MSYTPPPEPPEDVAHIIPRVYDRLRQRAKALMDAEPVGQTLTATALLHEALLRVIESPRQWESDAHFVSSVVTRMRNLLVDIARRKKAAKHGGGRERLDIDPVLLPGHGVSADDLLDLDEALTQLATTHPDQASVANARLFGGLSNKEIAAVLGVSLATVERWWAFARAHLSLRLAGPEEKDGKSEES